MGTPTGIRGNLQEESAEPMSAEDGVHTKEKPVCNRFSDQKIRSRKPFNGAKVMNAESGKQVFCL